MTRRVTSIWLLHVPTAVVSEESISGVAARATAAATAPNTIPYCRLTTAPTLITGTPGWLGTRLVQVLTGRVPELSALSQPDRTRRIRCLVMPGVDPSPLPASERVELVAGDLRARDQVEAFCTDAAGATLYHCAGLVHPARYVRDLHDVDIDGTKHLLQAAERAGIGHEIQARGKLDTVILRPAWFYGPGQPERQTTFFRMI
jgi:nucleoside-diphosphate-sugar epimerase